MKSELPPYVPPTGDQPLDAVQEALVRWATAIVVARIRAAGAGLPPSCPSGSSRVERTGDGEQQGSTTSGTARSTV